MRLVSSLFSLTALLVGCASTQPPPPKPIEAPPEPEASPFAEQQRHGARFYSYNCTACHGPNGEGAFGGPPLFDATGIPVDPPKTAKRRTTKFENARDVEAFVRTHMPEDYPGGLPQQQYWDVVAYVLVKGKVDLANRVLTAANASEVNLAKP